MQTDGSRTALNNSALRLSFPDDFTFLKVLMAATISYFFGRDITIFKSSSASGITAVWSGEFPFAEFLGGGKELF